MRKITLVTLTLFVLLATLIMAVPAHAMSNPDPPGPTMIAAYAHRNLLELNDVLYIWQAVIPYAVIPEYSVSNTFIWRLVALDGVTMLGTTTGYAYRDGGYNHNVFSMYFSASIVETLGMTWNANYTLRLSGNPAVFSNPPTYDFVSSINYTTLTSSIDNKNELAAKVMLMANDLNTQWGLAGTPDSLVSETETGGRLSAEGQAVFRGCVFGLQALAPGAFPESIVQINAPDRAWNTTYSTNLENQYQGSWVEQARQASKDILGTGWDLTGLILLLGVCIALFFGNISITHNVWDAAIDVCFVAVIGTRLGIVGMAVTVLFAAIAFIYIATKIWRSVPGS